tara:strand:+ start:820 stop:1296 length:477 start_codon:yes stop_codon:yes gene_type:complete
MKNKIFRIGQRDYEIIELWDNSVRIDLVPRYGETKKMGKDFDTEKEALNSVCLEAIKGFKKYTLTIKEALEVAKNIFSLYHVIDGRKSGYIVILAKKDPMKLTHVDECRYYYCRGKKAAEEISVDSKLLPHVIDITSYDKGQMFHLNHGMSYERYMST